MSRQIPKSKLSLLSDIGSFTQLSLRNIIMSFWSMWLSKCITSTPSYMHGLSCGLKRKFIVVLEYPFIYFSCSINNCLYNTSCSKVCYNSSYTLSNYVMGSLTKLFWLSPKFLLSRESTEPFSYFWLWLAL